MYEESDDEATKLALMKKYSQLSDNDLESDQSDDFTKEAINESNIENEIEDEKSSSEDETIFKKINTLYTLEKWDILLGVQLKLDFHAVLLEDIALRRMWIEKEENEIDVDEEDDEEIANQESDIDFENLDQLEDSSEEEEEELEDMHSSDEEEDNGEDEFSLNDLESKNENEDVTSEEEAGVEPFELTSDYEEKLNNLNTLIESQVEKPRVYRKLPKYAPSDASEYLMIHSESEDEQQQVTIKVLEDPTPVRNDNEITYENEINYVEPYDGNWLDTLYIKYKDSDPSSREDSDNNNIKKDISEEYDVPKYDLEKTELSVVRNKHRKDIKHQSKRKRAKIIEDCTAVAKNGPKLVEQPNAPAYALNLDVYNHHNYPKYDDVIESNIISELKNDSSKDNDNKKEDEENTDQLHQELKKTKYPLKRKKRNLLYERLHPWYKLITSNDFTRNEKPDEDIPSYKAKSKTEQIRDKTINETMNLLMNQISLAVSEIKQNRIREEAELYSNSIIDELCANIIETFHEKQKKDAVKYTMEVILDSWEDNIYHTKLRLIENQLDYIAEEITKKSLTRCFDEIIEEDIASTLLVRDVFAESLDELGMKRIKINRRLARMFTDYKFDIFDFEMNDKAKIRKAKTYKQRKYYDSFLKDRLKKRELMDKELKNKEEKVKELEKKELLRQKQIEESSIRRLLEKEKLKINEEKQSSEEIDNSDSNIEKTTVQSPLDVTPNNSDNEQTQRQPISKRDINKRTKRMLRRIKVVNLWLNTNKNLLFSKREENAKRWNEHDSEVEQPDDENESEKEVLKYTDEPLENIEIKSTVHESDNEIFNFSVPKLSTEVEKALKRNKTPDSITLVQQLGDGRVNTNTFHRNDSALGSDTIPASKHRSPDSLNQVLTRTRINSSDCKNYGTTQQRGESGFSSGDDSSENNAKYLLDRSTEPELEQKEIIKMIPNIDREQYLQIWLENDNPMESPGKVSPCPPITLNPKKQRKFRHKRPLSTMSIDSVKDIVPLDEYLVDCTRRKITNEKANDDRPESENTVYTGRNSVFSVHDFIYDNKEVHSKEERIKHSELEKAKLERLSFQKWKDDEKQKIIDTSDAAAWAFYEKQHQFTREKKEQVQSNITNSISLKTKNEILKKHTKILLTKTNAQLEMDLNHGSSDKELLRAFQNQSESDVSDSRISHSPPVTPWELKNDRPLTPDTDDTNDKISSLKLKYHKKIAKDRKNKFKHQEKENTRLWRTFVKGHVTQLEDDSPRNSATASKVPKAAWSSLHGKIEPTASTNANVEFFKRLQIKSRNCDTKQKERLLPRRASHFPVAVKRENNREVQSDEEYSKTTTSLAKPTKSRKMKKKNSKEKLPPITTQKNKTKKKIK